MEGEEVGVPGWGVLQRVQAGQPHLLAHAQRRAEQEGGNLWVNAWLREGPRGDGREGERGVDMGLKYGGVKGGGESRVVYIRK